VNAQKKQLLIVGILGVVLAAVLGFELTKGPPGPANTAAADMSALKKAEGGATSGTAKPPTSTKAAPLVAKDGEMDINKLLGEIKEVDFDFRAKKMPRDVMEPLVGLTTGKTGEKKTQKKGPKPGGTNVIGIMQKVISGILWDPIRPLAVVDDEVVYPGFEYKDIDGNVIVVVESIEQEFVVFKFEDILIQVNLKEDLKGNLDDLKGNLKEQ